MKFLYKIAILISLFLLLFSAEVFATEKSYQSLLSDEVSYENIIISENTSENDYIIENYINNQVSILSTEPQSFTYKDVYYHNWFYEEVTELTKREIFTNSTGYFEPNNYLTRAQMTKILAMCFGNNMIEDSDANGCNKYTDVSLDHWARKFIGWATREHIVTGTTTTTFEPDQKIKRQDIAVMVVRFCENAETFSLPKINPKYNYYDDASISEYAKTAVYTLQQAGILDSGANISFRPHDYITRAEAAKIIFVLFEHLIDSCTVETDSVSDVYMKFHAPILTTKAYSNLTIKYRISDNGTSWTEMPYTTIYDCMCTIKTPSSLMNLYQVEFSLPYNYKFHFANGAAYQKRYTNYAPTITNEDWLSSGTESLSAYKIYRNHGLYAGVTSSIYLNLDEGTAGNVRLDHSILLY